MRVMRYLTSTLTFVFALAMLAAPAIAGAPTDQLKKNVDEVVRTLEDSALKDKPAQRLAAVRKISENIFDYKETAKRSLGQHWNARTPQEQEDFVRLFADLLGHARAAWEQLERHLDVTRCEMLAGIRLRGGDPKAAAATLRHSGEEYERLGVEHLARHSYELAASAEGATP